MTSSSSSSSSSPCAACKLLRRKCAAECVFAPHFPPDQPAKFANVHRVFGASNVAKLLKQLRPEQREDAVMSLAYEADARLRDPVNGCVGYIHLLQRRLSELQHDLSLAEKELSNLVAGHHLLGLPQHAFAPSFPPFAGAVSGFAGQTTTINTQPSLQAEVLSYDRMGVLRATTTTSRLPAAQFSNSAGTIGAFLEQQQRQQLQQHHNSEQAQAKSRSEGRNSTGLSH
ncbi:LOB domain-containing protein 4-like [Curcuma longa]|uniref:LOB domain-containing protein 4-like n=1 Tax=Curcuma longa TaxID=136217 RepID=UPI003D9F68A2